MRCPLAYFALLLGVLTSYCQAETARSAMSSPRSSPRSSSPLVQRIDQVLRQQWQQAELEPAPPVDDREFLRRATLDFNGVIPRMQEIRNFLADPRPDKRERLLQQLLLSPRYATHLATVWRNRILPSGAEQTNAVEAAGLQKWLQTRFAKNLRYDGLVAELLLVSGEDALGPGLYFHSHDLAPEKLAASVSELFLGVDLQCAQCHDHPEGDWSQQDFWGLAACFAQVQAPDQQSMRRSYRLVDTDSGEVHIPDTQVVVPPKFPRSNLAVERRQGTRREQLVLWLTSRDNRLFARAGVQWAWQHLLGRGLVESLDAPGTGAQQQLLEELADAFIDSGFDLRALLLTIARSQAYQRSSQGPLAPPELFARFLPRPLSPEQLYDSFALLSPHQEPLPVGTTDEPNSAVLRRVDFVRRMREPAGPPTEYRAGTLQALLLMNGPTTAALTSPPQSRLLGALEAPFLSHADRIEVLFLTTLCRLPDPEEKTMCLEALAQAQTEQERLKITSDLLWAMVNSTEFTFNR